MRDLIQEQHPDVEVRPSPSAACHIEVVPEMVGGRWRAVNAYQGKQLTSKTHNLGLAAVSFNSRSGNARLLPPFAACHAADVSVGSATATSDCADCLCLPSL